MPSARQMHELLRLAERYDARLVFCGDTRQIQPLEAEMRSAFHRPELVAEAYRAAGNNVLVICPTHEEIRRITHAIREDRRQRGQLTADPAASGWIPVSR